MAAFLAVVVPIPLIVPMTLFLAGSFLAATGFLTIVVPLLISLESLMVLAVALPALDVVVAVAGFLPRTVPVVFAVVPDATLFDAAVALVLFACSTIFVRIAAGPVAVVDAEDFVPGAGRVFCRCAAGVGRIGDCGYVRELDDFGDRT